ncbi:hypothetical protein HMPREF1863_00449 [Aedoeadaptatus coxii]|uniref:Uncharacterized protein n=1 Tax=Aedoeadaptatus coxii TaxID=755172 RepID=A0A134AJ91_9FIRM|nr:hypothetical protein HMPREF1863_00449 [Peptoniphilus coxii]
MKSSTFLDIFNLLLIYALDLRLLAICRLHFLLYSYQSFDISTTFSLCFLLQYMV